MEFQLSQLPRLQTQGFRTQAAWCLGTSVRMYRTAFVWSHLRRGELQW